MFMTLRREWKALDASKGDHEDRRTAIPAGRHEIERIPNPLGTSDCFWFVLKGTLVGASEGSWRQWQNGTAATDPNHPGFGNPVDMGEFEVIIEDDTPAEIAPAQVT